MASKMVKKTGLFIVVMLFAVVFLTGSAMAAGEFEISRTISSSHANAGDTVSVTLVVAADQYIVAPAIQEELPSGWVLTEVSDQNASYKSSTTEWIWTTDMDEGEQKTLIYDLTIPSGTSDGTYSITGNATAYEVSALAVQGDSQVTVGSSSSGLDADFSANKTSGQVPLTVRFTDESTGDMTSWAWDFGDGNTSSLQSPLHTYNTEGTFSVSLAVSDGANSDTRTRTGYIIATGNGAIGRKEVASVSLSCTIIPAVSIEVTPEAIDFGALAAGETSDLQTISITNRGTADSSVTVQVMDVANDLYVDGLKLDSDSWQDYLMTVSPQSTETVNVSLNVPSDYTGIGAMEGKVVFWAETG